MAIILLTSSVCECRWSKHAPGPFNSKEDFLQEAVRHVETTLARSMYNCDAAYVVTLFPLFMCSVMAVGICSWLESRAAYGGTALAFKDRLIVDWNKTQQKHTYVDQKRVYCTVASGYPLWRYWC